MANSDTLILSRDLFFTSRIKDVARQCGGEPRVIRSLDTLREEISVKLADKRVQVFVDLDKPSVALEMLADTLLPLSDSNYQIVCFFSHVHVDLAQQAKELGFQTILPRSKFVTILPDLLT